MTSLSYDIEKQVKLKYSLGKKLRKCPYSNVCQLLVVKMTWSVFIFMK